MAHRNEAVTNVPQPREEFGRSRSQQDQIWSKRYFANFVGHRFEGDIYRQLF